MKMLTSTLILLVAATGCAKMKETMGQMKDKAQSTASSAQSKYNSEVQKHANPNGTAQQDPGPPQGGAGPDGGQNNAVAAGGAGAAATTASQGSESDAGMADGSGAGDAAGSTNGDPGDAGDVAVSDSGNAAGSDASSSAVAYVPDCSKPNNAPESVDASGTERSQWTDAKKGAYTRFRMSNNMEMSYEVKDATDKLILLETRTFLSGNLVSCSLDWQARRFKKVEVAETEKVEYETKTTDLPDEVIDVAGMKVNCKVRRIWSKVQGVESTSVMWTSSEVPGETVKVASETANGLETVYQLVEYRG